MDWKERAYMRRMFVERFTGLNYDMRPAHDDSSRFFHILTQAAWENWQASWEAARAYDPDTAPNPFANKAAPARRTRTR